MSGFWKGVGRVAHAVPRPPIATFGAAVVASIFNAGVILAIALLPWPESAALSRIDALKWLGLAQTALTAIVVISWAWGRPENVSFRLGVNQIDLDFDKNNPRPLPPDPPTS